MSVVFLSSCALPGLSIRDYDREPDQYATSDDPRYLDEDEVDYDPVVHSITPALVLNQQVADTIETGGPGGARHNERLDAEYKVGPGDVLSVIVWVHPDLTNPTGATENLESAGRLVQADGTIFFPFVGTINVEGRSVKQIRSMLTVGLESVVREPQVDLRVLSNPEGALSLTSAANRGDYVAPKRCILSTNQAPAFAFRDRIAEFLRDV